MPWQPQPWHRAGVPAPVMAHSRAWDRAAEPRPWHITGASAKPRAHSALICAELSRRRTSGPWALRHYWAPSPGCEPHWRVRCRPVIDGRGYAARGHSQAGWYGGVRLSAWICDSRFADLRKVYKRAAHLLGWITVICCAAGFLAGWLNAELLNAIGHVGHIEQVDHDIHINYLWHIGLNIRNWLIWASEATFVVIERRLEDGWP